MNALTTDVIELSHTEQFCLPNSNIGFTAVYYFCTLENISMLYDLLFGIIWYGALVCAV